MLPQAKIWEKKGGAGEYFWNEIPQPLQSLGQFYGAGAKYAVSEKTNPDGAPAQCRGHFPSGGNVAPPR